MENIGLAPVSPKMSLFTILLVEESAESGTYETRNSPARATWHPKESMALIFITTDYSNLIYYIFNGEPQKVVSKSFATSDSSLTRLMSESGFIQFLITNKKKLNC